MCHYSESIVDMTLMCVCSYVRTAPYMRFWCVSVQENLIVCPYTINLIKFLMVHSARLSEKEYKTCHKHQEPMA